MPAKENDIEKTNYIYSPNYAVISKQTIDKTVSEKTNNLIDDFINLCNDKKPEEAYSLLSQDCKDEMFISLDNFINNYYNKIFTNYKIHNIQLWKSSANSYTYKVRILDDILASGKDNEGKAIEDYFTVINVEGKYYLNINGYIEKRDINQEINTDNLSIKILYKQIFLDYEKYTLKITNNTLNNILLDGFREPNSIYLSDINDNKYMVSKNEMIEGMFLIYSKNTFETTIKFNKRNDQNAKINSMNFSDIILNYG
jgi:hypothetical protein